MCDMQSFIWAHADGWCLPFAIHLPSANERQNKMKKKEGRTDEEDEE